MLDMYLNARRTVLARYVLHDDALDPAEQEVVDRMILRRHPLEGNIVEDPRPITLEQALAELTRETGLSEDDALEGLLYSSVSGGEELFVIEAYPLTEIRPTLQQAYDRARRLSGVLAGGTSALILDETSTRVLATYRLGEPAGPFTKAMAMAGAEQDTA